MKKRKFLSAKTIALLSAAALLLLGSTVGSTRAALTYYSDNYAAQVNVSSIGVSLTENGKIVSSRDYSHKDDVWHETSGNLLEGLEENGEIIPGKKYDEKLGVKNTGSIDSYVRVILTKSWKNKDGKKDPNLNPDWIEVNLAGNGWVVDPEASTPERTILYYTKIVKAGDSTPDFADSLKINNQIAQQVKTETSTDKNGNEVITHVYKYDGYQFELEAEVNAVQTHNAKDAIKSAWGVNVKEVLADGTLKLQSLQ